MPKHHFTLEISAGEDEKAAILRKRRSLLIDFLIWVACGVVYGALMLISKAGCSKFDCLLLGSIITLVIKSGIRYKVWRDFSILYMQQKDRKVINIK